MKQELPKVYNPKDYEDKIYEKWEKSGYFNPDNLPCEKNAPTYTIVLPPPNITDKLHIGHASVLAIEDLMIRYHRMKGYKTLWIPGTDHASIATQNVVEKKLLREQGLTRHDLGKDKFLKEVWKFLKETQATILHQTRKMGASLDWSREAFTLDDQRKKAVAQMFVDMHEAGIIYRGERIVNWCPRCQSTLADDEVEYKEQEAKLYYFKYNKDFPFTIATTRPETKLGDTAVAVNPKDARYKKYINKTYKVDFCGVNLNLKIITDKEVDMKFGTGALGVTPAHSMADWQMAKKNNLKIIKVIDEQGKIHQGFGAYSSKTVKLAREMIVKKLKNNNLLEKQEDINNNLSICYRCNTAIEPLLSKQWFVDVNKKIEKLGNKSLKQAAIEVVKSNKIKFIPERFTKQYLHWMENLHDWCISRQIWFGHSIPVYYRKQEIFNFQFSIFNEIPNPKFQTVNKEVYVGVEPPKGEGWKQDPDTLDTWFSSGMWTFSTLGWPSFAKATDGKPSEDLARFHPTQVLETGYEILTLWVSRMIMMSLFAIGEIPFENVYLNGMVLDKNGKKMSKSKGNGIDPLDMIEKFGTDAVRLALLIGNTPGNDMRLSEEKIEGCRNFINKLWNIARFVIETKFPKNYSESKSFLNNFFGNLVSSNLTDADRWILGKLNNLIKEVDNDLKNYKFSQAGEKLREFTWNDFADWYLEVSKFECETRIDTNKKRITTNNNTAKQKILFYILENLLKLWHPFIPFVTEVIWNQLSIKNQEINKLNHKNLLMIQKWSDIRCSKTEVELLSTEVERISTSVFRHRMSNNFEIIKNIIIVIRNARAENKVEPGKKIKAIICS
ncbi:valine--tRNA ligase, partial [Patescibacteria group bacterium]|nr:valine--tRNA ligase [Patescibacteria group bacterium]